MGVAHFEASITYPAFGLDQVMEEGEPLPILLEIGYNICMM
jgi:hypothetical protein